MRPKLSSSIRKPMQNEPLGRSLGRGEKKMKREMAAELHIGDVRRPSYLDADARPLGVTAVTAQSLMQP